MSGSGVSARKLRAPRCRRICLQNLSVAYRTIGCSMQRLVSLVLLGVAWLGVADAREWRTTSEQPFCRNSNDVLEYLLVMNVEGFKGKAIPGCTTLKAGLRVTTVNDDDSDQSSRPSGVVKIRAVQGGKVLVGYTFTPDQ
jgi:hypothetical protein